MSTPSENGRQFEMEIAVDAAEDAVWKAISSEVELRRWFPPEAKVEPGVGGEICWTWDEIAWRQTIEAWEPGKLLRTRYPRMRSRSTSTKSVSWRSIFSSNIGIQPTA